MEGVNSVLEDLLWMCILDFESTWEEHLPLVEFAYNNSYQTSIGMAPLRLYTEDLAHPYHVG